MKTLSLALSGAMILGLAAGASAQTLRSMQDADYDYYALTTGRSVYVNQAPRSDADADSIVMGLRVPNGLRTDGWTAR